jgi:Mg2+ and Co2+ transporter CorA
VPQRREMLVKAELSHVEDLHHIGCQLSTLKRLYVNYESIIDRLLEKQEVSLASLKNSHVLPPTSAPNSPNIHSMTSSHIQETEILGVSLSSAARVRFERLRHRIRLYAISEIQECLEQKESLVMMNFNLIAIKESYSVERLTRITLLLAKVTLIFMPVSLMTAYFSCQLKDVEFTAGTYWKWFGGVFGASIAGLFLFSFASGIMEGRIVDKPLSRRIFEVCGRFCRNKGDQEGGMKFEDG